MSKAAAKDITWIQDDLASEGETWLVTEDTEEYDPGALTPARGGRPLELRELLGRGGTAEVWRAWDPALDREVACKVLAPAHADNAGMVAHFLEEAGATARLQHPGIVAVHAIGVLGDGRPYFTMQEVRGRPYSELLADGERGDPLRRRRLCELLLRAAEVLAYAHDRGVLHRDFKPANVMVGNFGEVRVIDWGLLKKLESAYGSRSGTPAYMAPEQARGEPLSPASDVYALGATLFELLTGRPPHPGCSIQQRAQATEPLTPDGPLELTELCAAAMEPDPTRRTPDGGTFADALRRWLDGARARERALELVGAADAMRPEVEARWREARELAEAVEEQRGALDAAAPLEEKRKLWLEEDRAREATRSARLAELYLLQRLRAALEQSPELPEARERLADHYRRVQERAFAQGDADAAAEAESLVRAYDDGQHAAWLHGDGALTLLTDAPAEVSLQRYQPCDRQLIPGEVIALGRTPLSSVALPMGSYLVTLSAPGRAPARYPVHIARQHHWDGTPPGEHRPRPIPLVRSDRLGPDDLYVPHGWHLSGGMERIQRDFLPARRLWLDGFVIRRFPVTNTEFIRFLDDLVDQGRADEALLHAPRANAAAEATIYGRDDGGHFFLQPDEDGDLWDPRWPVLHVDFWGASAYAAWESERTGQAWRLPTELEWEKAARGVDGRTYPWGRHFDPLFCSMRYSRKGGAMPEPVDSYPTDVSPYGVRGMAGGAFDWCADPYRPEGPAVDDGGRALAPAPDEEADMRVGRGGAWSYNALACRADYRLHLKPGARRPTQSFRLCRALDQDDG